MSEEIEQKAQNEAVAKNSLPDGVKVSEPDTDGVSQYSKDNEQVREQLQKFGADDIEQFLAKIDSDRNYGRIVIRQLLGLDADKPFVIPGLKSSPQEKNQTGRLDHATYPPTVVEKQ